MTTPVQFMQSYRNLSVGYVRDTGVSCQESTATIQLRTYFMMNWTEGTEQRNDFNEVTSGGRNNAWFREHRDQILNAAMGKGSPNDYKLALEWAVASGKIRNPSQASIQTFCDEHLGIDCSGFVTNYLIAIGQKTSTPSIVRNTPAVSYFESTRAINSIHDIRSGHLLVWMNGDQVKRDPGHVAVIESFSPQSTQGGSMRVVEATGASGASPKLLDSMYTVEQIIDRNRTVPMILVVRRHGVSGNRAVVMRAT